MQALLLQARQNPDPFRFAGSAAFSAAVSAAGRGGGSRGRSRHQSRIGLGVA